LYLYGLKFIDENYGYTVGGNGTASSLILETTNGGITWTQQLFPQLVSAYNGVSFTGNSGVTAVGYNGSVIHRPFSIPIPVPSAPSLIFPENGTTNLPSSLIFDWNPVPSASRYRIRIANDSLFNSIVKDSIISIDSISLSGFEPNGKYYWEVSAINTGGSSPYSSVWNFHVSPLVPSAPELISPANGVVGLSPTITFLWNAVSTATSYRIKISSDSLFNTIVKDSIITSDSLTLTGFTNAQYYWKVASINSGGTGIFSSVWKFTVNPNGIIGIASDIPKEFKLHNNYPNPFNPITKIKFEVPKNSIVKISIYDITGREMRILVNSNYIPGTYEVIFDASTLSSGIYFYRMQTNSFNSVKRMVLIK
jgi:hypothetical protein